MDFTLWDIFRNLLLAARWTLLLSAIAFVGGGIGGIAVLLLRIAKRRWMRRPAELYIVFFQGTPLLMQLFLVFFGLPLLGLRIDPFSAAAVGLTLFASAYLSEIWRGGVEAIPQGQWDAAASLGLHHLRRLRLIVLPQAFRIVRAPTVGFLIQLVKSTSVTSIIGFDELLRASDAINNATFEPFLVYGLAALIYFAICFPLSRYERVLQARAAKP